MVELSRHRVNPGDANDTRLRGDTMRGEFAEIDDKIARLKAELAKEDSRRASAVTSSKKKSSKTARAESLAKQVEALEAQMDRMSVTSADYMECQNELFVLEAALERAAEEAASSSRRKH